jgi:hypothetical protein
LFTKKELTGWSYDLRILTGVNVESRKRCGSNKGMKEEKE